MSKSGHNGSPKRRPNIVPRSLFVPVILIVFVFLWFYLRNFETFFPKSVIIYPTWSQNTAKVILSDSGGRSERVSMACGVKVETDPVVKVIGCKTYVIGSYLEHRWEVKHVRTVAIVLRSEGAQYYCLFCCGGKNVTVAADCNIHSDHFGYDYGTADITCQVPKTCTPPEFVAIASQSSKNDIQSFQPVRNQQSLDLFPYDFTVCISVMYDYVNVLGLIQALEMYKILGVQKVVIYKTSCHNDTQKVLDFYIKQGFVDLIPWNVSSHISVSRGWQVSVSPGELHYFGQTAALNDCLYRYMYKSRYLALQDLDEFILPLKENNWTQLIPDLENRYSNSQPAGFEFENNIIVFSQNPKPHVPDLWKQIRGENILLHTNRLPNNPNEFNNFKVIINPRSVFRTTVHGVLESTGGTVRVDPEIARMYHVKNMSQDSASPIRDKRVQDYAEQLIPAVSKVLEEVLHLH